MKYKLQDLIDMNLFQNMQDRLNEIYSFPSAIIDNEGNILTATAWQDICTQFHRKNKECERDCLESDQYILSHLHEANPAVSYRCPRGLVDNATPIIVDGTHYGNFFTGQFFLEKPDLEFFRAQAATFGFDEAAYLTAVKKVPIWSQEQLHSYLFFIKGLIAIISESALKNLREIEARKKIEASEERASLILDQMLDGFWITEPQGGRIVDANAAMCLMSGYSRDELLKLSVRDVEAKDSPDEIKLRIEQIMQAGSAHFESRFRRKDGAIIDVDVSISYLSKPNLFFAFHRNITDRKRAEQERLASEVKFKEIFNNSIDAIGVSLVGIHEFVNPAYAALFGYASADDLVGKPILELIAPAEHPVIQDRIRRRALGECVPSAYETRGRRKDGSEFVMDIHASSYSLQGANYTLVIMRDITDRKQAEQERQLLEERLNRAEKMEALGQLAGGVAHDLNNVLGILAGYSELLLEEIQEGQRGRSYVDKILQSTQKGAAIIQDLLTLARRGVVANEVINLNSIVSDFLQGPVFDKLKEVHPRLTFRLELDNNLLHTKGSPVHLEKALMNLVANAAEAVSEAGGVTIGTENRYLDQPIQAYDEEIREGDYVVLTVADTGMGIPAEDRDKIFEPFYTKKKMGRSGTGLGLAIVWGTVKDHHGYIDIQTEVEKGTTFTLYFPVTREELTAPKQKEPMEQYMGQGESVLVVDDIADQREIASRLLTRLGYQVHLAASGEAAVEYLKTRKVDLLVLDMIMTPGIDGLETYRRILAFTPHQKAIIVSGYSETDRVKETAKLGAGAYVKKPYLTETIGLAIRDALRKNIA